MELVSSDDLRRERLARGLSIRKAAKLAGLSPSRISDIERGVPDAYLAVLAEYPRRDSCAVCGGPLGGDTE